MLSYSKSCTPAGTIAEVSISPKLCLGVVTPLHVKRHR